MPRAKVAPGRASKRSCSSASSWRGANLRLCATSARASPRASRAAASSWPTPVMATASVILASLERLVFGGIGITPAQLVGEGLLGHALAQAALDAYRQPQRLGAWRGDLVVARHQLARLAHAALAVADLSEAEQRDRLVRLELERALEERLGVLHLLHLKRAHARRGIRTRGRGVERVAQRVQEVLDRVRLARGLAQEPAVVVVDVGVVRRDAQRALEVFLGALVLLHLHVHQAVHAVGRRIVGVGRGRVAQLLERHAEVAVAVVERSQLGAQLGAVPRIADLADHGAGFLFGRLLGAAGEENEDRQQQKFFHARTSFRARLRRVRSATSPASWPQAAAMSSPRVLRVVTVSPARCSTSAKRLMRSGGERLKSDRGNGLNGMRLNLLRTLPASDTSSRAWLSASFTPSSITYSKVMKSRGALSR